MLKQLLIFIIGCANSVFIVAASNQNLIVPNSVMTPGGSNLGYVLDDNNVKIFKIAAAPVTKTIFDSSINLIEKDVPKEARYIGPTLSQPLEKQVVNGLGYNNSIPGPTIIVNEGGGLNLQTQL